MTKKEALKIATHLIGQDRYLSWGMDGYGTPHYLCRHCGKVFGPVDMESINHICPVLCRAEQMELFE